MFFLDVNDDGSHRIDHLECADIRGNKVWHRPSGKDDIQDADEIQILPVNVVGDYDFTFDKPLFVLSNEDEISENFRRLTELFKLDVDA